MAAPAWVECSVRHVAQPLLPHCWSQDPQPEGHGDSVADPSDQVQDSDCDLLRSGRPLAASSDPGLLCGQRWLGRCSRRSCRLRRPTTQDLYGYCCVITPKWGYRDRDDQSDDSLNPETGGRNSSPLTLSGGQGDFFDFTAAAIEWTAPFRPGWRETGGSSRGQRAASSLPEGVDGAGPGVDGPVPSG